MIAAAEAAAAERKPGRIVSQSERIQTETARNKFRAVVPVMRSAYELWIGGRKTPNEAVSLVPAALGIDSFEVFGNAMCCDRGINQRISCLIDFCFHFSN